MKNSTFENRRQLETLDSQSLVDHQLDRLNQLLAAILPHNRFYAEKFSDLALPLTSLDELANLPFTFKEELVAGKHEGDLAANLTWPLERYSRFHRTSGTHGRPMVVLDTPDDWEWWLHNWQFVLDAAELTPADRVLMAFSFGPFIGFWSAFDAVAARGCLTVPTGGMSSVARLDLLRNLHATALFCTPSYALHLAETAREQHIDPASLGVKKIVVAGEPGGSVPARRERIETAWNAKLIDHAGASEIGAWGYSDPQRQGLYINESEFLAEFRSLASGDLAGEGELSELVLTTLGRLGSPVIRYRTGDLVRPTWNGSGDCNFVLLEGGVLGRVDDMLVVRGVNIFPASIEQILLSFPEVVEYRLTAFTEHEMDCLRVEVEDRLQQPQRVAQELQLRLGLRIEVADAPLGSLPRFEGKGRRFIDQRSKL
ncbi:phenylacetate--CoA ligase family protein [Lignipirellula cremea]|nr:phenylacetate--CoA ligase [Lignipirellula cremea]